MSNNKQKAKRKILVVDDEMDSSTIFRIALEDNRFDVQKGTLRTGCQKQYYQLYH
jgi:hypothetical protein